MAESPLTASLTALSRFFVGDGTLEETLRRVADLTVEAVPAADLIGITMLVEGRHRTAIFTDETALEVDQAQYSTGSGPCLQAYQEQRITEIESTSEAGPWLEFRAAAAAHGIGSTMFFPLIVEKAAVGAMNVYSYRQRAFRPRDREEGALFAAEAVANGQRDATEIEHDILASALNDHLLELGGSHAVPYWRDLP